MNDSRRLMSRSRQLVFPSRQGIIRSRLLMKRFCQGRSGSRQAKIKSGQSGNHSRLGGKCSRSSVSKLFLRANRPHQVKPSYSKAGAAAAQARLPAAEVGLSDSRR